MDKNDTVFMCFLTLLFLCITTAIIGVNYNECKVYENMSAAGYEQKIDTSFGYNKIIWVKVKDNINDN